MAKEIYEIEKREPQTGMRKKYPFEKLIEKDDCFFVPANPEKLNSSRTYCIYAAKRSGIKITTRAGDKGKIKGFYVWKHPKMFEENEKWIK